MKHQVGIIGCGWVAPFHINALGGLTDRVQIVWVADPVPDRTRVIARQVAAGLKQEAKQLSDYHKGLASVDSVLILLPHHLHHRATVEALEAGCDVLLEKPLAISLSEADEMIETAARRQKLLMVAYPHRYRSTTKKFKELIDSGEYGKLFLLDAMMDENLRGYADLGWLSKKSTLGGGVFFSASPHMLDVMLWIGGFPKTISMVGAHAGINMEGEDTAVSVMKFASGAIGTTRHTWMSPSPRVWYTMRAYCEDAVLTLTVNPLGDLVTEGYRCPWRSRIEVSPPGRVLVESDEGLDFTGEITHFFDCLDTGQPCMTDAREVRQIMELVLGAYQKAERDGGN